MAYTLNQTEISMFRTIDSKLSVYYLEQEAKQLHKILYKAIKKGVLDDNDIYVLLELLPHIRPSPYHENIEIADECNDNWQYYIDEQQEWYMSEIEKLHHILCKWIFLQSSVYQRKDRTLEKNFKRNKSHNRKI